MSPWRGITELFLESFRTLGLLRPLPKTSRSTGREPPTQSEAKAEDSSGENKMCGSLKHSHWANKDPIRVGQEIPREADLKPKPSGPVIWNGFARQENLSAWTSKGWTPGTLTTDYEEGGKWFSRGEIQMVSREVGGTTFVNLVTRPPKTEEERKLHSRWPLEAKSANSNQ